MRKGQFSTLLKPVVLIVFTLLIVWVLTSSTGFRIGLLQDQQEAEFDSRPSKVFTDVSGCLSVDDSVSGGSYTLNQSKLEMAERRYQLREPPCAESFRNGYSVLVEQGTTNSVSPTESTSVPADVVFALDDSGSMGDYIDDVRDNTEDFIESLPPTSRVGMFTYSSPPGDYLRHRVNLTQDESRVVSKLNGINTPGGDEPEDLALKYARESFDWSETRRRIVVLLATEAANKDSGTPKTTIEQAELTDESRITVYPVSSAKGTGYTEIAEITGGKRYDVTADYSEVFKEIAGGERSVVSDNACSVPAEPTYEGSVDLVFAADGSASFDSEWATLCGKVQDTVSELSSSGLEVNTSVYIPGNPGGMANGVGVPVDLNGSYNQTPGSQNLPSCVASGNANAAKSKYGRGITAWNGTGLVQYNSDIDYGLEAWGVFSKWIAENHNWSESADKRMMFVVGDQDPTGGGGGDTATFRDTGTDGVLDTEEEIVDNLTALGDKHNISVYTLASDMEYSGTAMYGNSDKNDAVELMEVTSFLTGAEHLEYEEASEIPEIIKEQFLELQTGESSGGFCNEVNYTFGSSESSKGQSREGRLVSRYRTTVRVDEGVKAPADMFVTLTGGGMERLSGSINQVVKAARSSGSEVTRSIFISTNDELQLKYTEIERPKKGDYWLENSAGERPIDVKGRYYVGVNGRKALTREDSGTGPGTTPSTFGAYKGAELQLVVTQSNDEEGSIGRTFLNCQSCSDRQELTPGANQGPDSYVVLNTTEEIEIGPTTEDSEPAVCNPDDDACTLVRAEVERTTVEPGSYNAVVSYRPGAEVTIRS